MIDDLDDPLLNDYRHLRDPSRRQRLEAERGILIAEGAHAIAALLRSRFPARSLLVADTKLAAAEALVHRLDIPVHVAPLHLLRTFVGFDVHRGLLAAGGRLPPTDAADVIDTAASLAVVEGVNDHENIGALFRNAAALGVGGVLLDRGCSDPLYRRAIRVSAGHALLVPFARWDSCADGLERLHAAGFSTVALTPAESATAIDALPSLGKPAIVVGTEGPGLSPETLARATHRGRIPMAPGVDSLNVATAAAIAFHRLVAGPTPRACPP